jgi:hypothetical protein
MRPPQATIRGILGAVIWCALILALGRMLEGEALEGLLLLTPGPMCGAIVQRCGGGRGILGGVIGGLVWYVGYGVVMYLWAYLWPQPNTVDYLGPGLTFILLASSGTVAGFVIGFLLWGAMLIVRAR